MAYPVIQTPPVPAANSGDCLDCIVSLPVQSTTSMRFSTTITEGQNLVLRNVGTINATYTTDNVAEESLTIQPGTFFTVNQPTSALLVRVSSDAVVNLILAGDVAIALNVAKMIFIDQELQGFEVSVPAGQDAVAVQVDLFYAITAQ
jgi:hypothetical protein